MIAGISPFVSRLWGGVSRRRSQLACACLACFALSRAWQQLPASFIEKAGASVFSAAHREALLGGMGNDDISAYERRFAPLRPLLPSHGSVGYVTGVPAEQVLSGGAADRNFHLVQYFLAPTLVLNDPDAALVIGNYDTQAELEAASRPGYKRVAGFGEGLALFRRGRTP